VFTNFVYIRIEDDPIRSKRLCNYFIVIIVIYIYLAKASSLCT